MFAYGWSYWELGNSRSLLVVRLKKYEVFGQLVRCDVSALILPHGHWSMGKDQGSSEDGLPRGGGLGGSVNAEHLVGRALLSALEERDVSATMELPWGTSMATGPFPT